MEVLQWPSNHLELRAEPPPFRFYTPQPPAAEVWADAHEGASPERWLRGLDNADEHRWNHLCRTALTMKNASSPITLLGPG